MMPRTLLALAMVLALASPGAADLGGDTAAAPLSGDQAVRQSDRPSQPDPIRPPSRQRGSTVARFVAPAFARVRPRAARRGWPLSTQTAWSGQAQRLLVLDSAFAVAASG
jgi:hypothetical protein